MCVLELLFDMLYIVISFKMYHCTNSATWVHLGTFVWDTWVTLCSMSCSSLIFEVMSNPLLSYCCHPMFFIQTIFIQIIPSILSVCLAVLGHLKDDAATIKNRKRMFISLYFLLPDLLVLYSPTFNSHFHKIQSVSFQMIPRICISLPLGLSYRQLD